MPSELPFRIACAVLFGLLFVLRMTFHIRARIFDPGKRDVSEGRAVRWVRPVGVPLFMLATFAWLFAPATVAWALLPIAPGWRWLGAGITVLGLLLLLWVHVALDKNFSPFLRIRADHELITHGPYRYVRHPMYTAFLLIAGGLALLTAYWLFIVTLFAALGAVLVFRTPREEAMLREHFGAAYDRYAAHTGALLPRL